MKRQRIIGWLGLFLLAVVLAAAVAAPVLAPHDPEVGDLGERLLPPFSQGHLLGTDQQGRDLLSRVIFGARVSVVIAVASVAVSGVLGTSLGLVSGYFGGWIDRIIMLVVNVQMSFPFIVLALAISAILGSSMVNVVIALVITSWVSYTRLVRGVVLELRTEDYVTAAQSLGASHLRVIVRHILPNALNSVTVLASLEISRLIIAEASISFLGFGVMPPTPAWGAMLADSRSYIITSWWLPTFPGLALALTALGANLLGDWVRDLTDPNLRSK